MDLFEWYDYFFLAVVLATSFAIGITFACIGDRQRTINEYFTANGKLGIVPVALSSYMTVTSGINLIGNAAEVYTYGVQMWFASIGFWIANIVSILCFAPLFHRLKLVSYNEYILKRYDSRACQLINTVFNVARSLLFIGFCVFMPATSLEAVTSIPMWGTIVLLCMVGALYTSLGGIKAVVYTDSFQAAMLFSGTIVITVLGVQKAGGMTEIWNTLKEYDRLDINFNPTPQVRMSFWSTIIGNFFVGLTSWGPSQFAVQRYSTLSSVKKVKQALALLLPMGIVLTINTYIIGGAMFTFYMKSGCDPLVGGTLSNPNQLMAYYVNDGINRKVLPGLFAATLAAGALSSVSTSISSCSVTLWQDIFAPMESYNKLSDLKKTAINKILTFVFGGISIGLGYAMKFFPGHGLQVAQTINTAVMSPVLGMFILASIFPHSNKWGAIVGSLSGFAFHIAQGLGSSLTAPYATTKYTNIYNCTGNTTNLGLYEDNPDANPLFRVGFEWIMPIGVGITIVVGLIVSFISGPTNPADLDPRYIIPLFDWVCCCFPARCLRKLWCGVDFSKLDDIDDKEEDEDLKNNWSMVSDEKGYVFDNEAFTVKPGDLGPYPLGSGEVMAEKPKVDWNEKSDWSHL